MHLREGLDDFEPRQGCALDAHLCVHGTTSALRDERAAGGMLFLPSHLLLNLQVLFCLHFCAAAAAAFSTSY